jgi:hypothetical protein
LRQLEDGPGYGLKLVAVIFEIFVVLTDSVWHTQKDANNKVISWSPWHVQKIYRTCNSL